MTKRKYQKPESKATELDKPIAMIATNSLGEYIWPWDRPVKEEEDFEFKKKDYNLFNEKEDIWTQEWKE